ncbi:exopolysaccharide biosynthesis polyprenyl glycosylphosphotransferase [uncultured Parasphingorhabdus sp.]|uniref:exopolysaccharide biosynthesis polyprenyl glycosylphosphotransferase n=1 Tax=uncultured Parasphingorhabdus sp. TaxID=2709694 RepID=UPI0030DC43E0
MNNNGHDQRIKSYPARDKRTFLYAFSLLLDILSMFGGYAAALLVRDPQWLQAGNQALIVVALPIFIMFEIARGAQSAETLANRLLAIQRSLGALVASILVVTGLTFLFGAGEVSRVGFVVTFAATAILIVISKFVVDLVFKKTMDGLAIATILLIDGLDAKPESGVDIFDAGQAGLWPDLDHPEMIDALSRVIGSYDRVIIACRYEHRAAWSTFLKGHDVGGEILLDRDLLHGAVAIGSYADNDTIIISHGPLNLFNRLQKRGLDLIVASVALIFLSPLLLLVAFAIKMDSSGPVLFRQVRVGQGNRQFRIFKFRSMRVESNDAKGDRSTGREDDRVTRVGRLIRRTSIDELPQLFNVLRGEMSMVGPRPHALGSLAGDALFWRVSNHYWLRHALKPGITGLAQIRGFRGATDKKEDLEKRLRCDLEYLSNWSIGLDVMILVKTLPVVIHKNAF